MVVRLAFATAIHLEPELLVVDEALAVGDVGFQQKCLNRIREMQRAGTSILLVTHSTNTLVEYCDRGILLQHGELVLDGPCRDVVKAYADALVRDEGGESAPGAGGEADAAGEVPASLPLVASQREVGGEAPITIESVALVDDTGRRIGAVERGATVQVRLRVRVRTLMAQPCFGIQLSSPDGIALWSATTQAFPTPVPALAPGLHEFGWRINANFGAARYVVALGAGQLVDGDYRRCHRVDYAGHFDVLPQPHAGSGWLATDVCLDMPVAVECAE
jgi:lipopolysaccharide transport system ATP-binding protein